MRAGRAGTPPEKRRRTSRELPLFRWTRRVVLSWMRLNATSVVPRLLRIDRDLFVDFYLVLMVPVLAGLLVLWRPCSGAPSLYWLRVLTVALAIWIAQEVACVTLFDLVREKPIRGRKRWMLATLPTVAHVVLAFAILFLWLGEHFEPAITDWLSALYQSVITFSTVGYGDYHPAHGSPWGKVIVICEQSLFLLLVVIRVPMAVSMLRMRDVEDDGPG
jgi:hypothetical protein